jgi:hypothetical protein
MELAHHRKAFDADTRKLDHRCLRVGSHDAFEVVRVPRRGFVEQDFQYQANLPRARDRSSPWARTHSLALRLHLRGDRQRCR